MKKRRLMVVFPEVVVRDLKMEKAKTGITISKQLELAYIKNKEKEKNG